MKSIFVENKEVFIDDSDLEEVLKYYWSLDIDGYPVTLTRIGGKLKKISIQRLLLRPSHDLVVDHINGNPLDNRRSNLRTCTQRENLMNRKFSPKNTSGYRGVSWRSEVKAWTAIISVRGKNRYLGKYKSSRDAAIAYDKAALKFYGNFSNPNILLGKERNLYNE